MGNNFESMQHTRIYRFSKTVTLAIVCKVCDDSSSNLENIFIWINFKKRKLTCI